MDTGVAAFLISLLIVVCLAGDEDDKEAKIRFYFRTIDDFKEIPLNSSHDVLNSSWYNSTRNTIIFCHGFTGSARGRAVQAVMRAYLEQGESNVALLNWEGLAADSMSSIPNSYINWAAPNARQLGVNVAEALARLSSGVDLRRLYLIGHSLGAHVFGIAGNNLRLNGILLPWILGLDPASLGFENKPPAMRLNKNSAELVTVIHSDPSKYGTKVALGTVDFWPNYRAVGPVRQPGCAGRPGPVFSPEDLCSHHRSWELLVDAIKQPGTIVGSHATNFRTWKRSSPAQRAATTMPIEAHNKNATPGNYFLVTSSQPPYGLGENGL